MFKRLWCFLSGGRLVWLCDRDNEVTLAIARRDPFGRLTAERWWPFRVRTVVLLEDGVVDGGA